MSLVLSTPDTNAVGAKVLDRADIHRPSIIGALTIIALVVTAPVNVSAPVTATVANIALAFGAALIVGRDATLFFTAIAEFLPTALFITGLAGLLLG